MIYAKTRKKGLIEELSECGVSVPYKRVMEIQTQVTKQLCKIYQDQESVCPPRLLPSTFTVAAIDNLDHNPSSTTASRSFHGTGISIFQFPSNNGYIKELNLPPPEACKNVEMQLPAYYNTVEPTKSSLVSTPLQTINTSTLLEEFDFLRETRQWFENVQSELGDGNIHSVKRINWSAFHANKLINKAPICKAISVMMPLLQDEIATNAMVRHTMEIIEKVHKVLLICSSYNCIVTKIFIQATS